MRFVTRLSEHDHSDPTSAIGPVFKFGGTSMGSIERIEHVANICQTLSPSAVVVSAMAGETNRLVSLGQSISHRTDVPEYDLLVASGEQVSVALLSLALRKRGIVPYPMLAPHAGIQTDDKFSRALIQSVNKEFILSKISAGFLPIIAGFQGVTAEGQLTSLGRGGSDTSAVAVAAAIGSPTCVIYTDVDGVFTTDPRICPAARIIRTINFEEMLEMASQGSKVLHIRSVQLAAKYGLNLVVKNTFSQDPGTTMSNITKNAHGLEGEIVTGVAAAKEEAWINLQELSPRPDVLYKVFSSLAAKGINVDIITQYVQAASQNKISINFTVALADLDLAAEHLAKTFPEAKVTTRNDVAKVSIVGVGMRTHPGVAARMFEALAKESIEVLLVTTSEIKVACLVQRAHADAAVRSLHKEFVESSYASAPYFSEI